MTMTTELHTYLALAGNQRIPHLEEEIFTDEEATTVYLHNLCRDLVWYEKNDTNACLVYYYAAREIKGAWAAAEHIITPSRKFGRRYAAGVCTGRFDHYVS